MLSNPLMAQYADSLLLLKLWEIIPSKCMHITLHYMDMSLRPTFCTRTAHAKYMFKGMYSMVLGMSKEGMFLSKGNAVMAPWDVLARVFNP